MSEQTQTRRCDDRIQGGKHSAHANTA